MLTILGTIMVVLATMGIGVVVDRRWSIVPRRERLLAGESPLQLTGHVPGDEPGTARTLSAGELEMLRRARCASCRGDTDALADTRELHGERELLVVHARCRRCGLARSTYVAV